MAEPDDEEENFQVSGNTGFVLKSCEESRKIWLIALPALLTSLLQYGIGAVTIAFVGHLGSTELAAVSLAMTVIETFSFGVLVGMGSALETLCGQAVGAGKLSMLGIYMQRSCIITISTALILTPTYIFASPILKLLRQSHQLSDLAQHFALRSIPQLFAHALNFPLQKFFQSQSHVWLVTLASGASLLLHALLCWVLVVKFGLGLPGAAYAGDISRWALNVAQVIYLTSGYFPSSWTGLSLSAFHSLTGFLKLSVASAVMLCLETWYYTAVILVAGHLSNPEIAVDSISICVNFELLIVVIALGTNAAVSVRVSNELGARHPKAAKLSVMVAISTSFMMGILFMSIVFITRENFPKLFTSEPRIVRETSKLGTLLALSLLLNSIQPVLTGVAIGAGWQFLVALVNICCYYVFGLPVGGILSINFKLGPKGLWSGMLLGTLLQTVTLLLITFRTNWKKEVFRAEKRVKTWGGNQFQQESTF